jgi:hypothetical protein
VVGVYFPDTYPYVPAWQAVYSFYGPPYQGSPPNIQAVHADRIEYDLEENATRIWSQKLPKNTWMNFARRYKLSTDDSGWMELYYSTGNEPMQLQTLSSGKTIFKGPTVNAAHAGDKNNFRISNYRSANMQGFGDVSIYYRRVSLWPGAATLADINDYYF